MRYARTARRGAPKMAKDHFNKAHNAYHNACLIAYSDHTDTSNGKQIISTVLTACLGCITTTAVILFILLYARIEYTSITMVKTSAEHSIEMDFILNSIFMIHEDSKLKDALDSRSIVTVDDMASMNFKTIDELKYKDDNNKLVLLPLGDRQLLKIFATYVHKLGEQDSYFSPSSKSFIIFMRSPRVDSLPSTTTFAESLAARVASRIFFFSASTFPT